MTECCTLYVTFPTQKEAEAVCRSLLEEGLIACGNICAGMTSLYRWEGQVCEEPEVALFLKTTAGKAKRAIARITELHSYDTPCVVQWDISNGNQAYLQWVGQEVQD